MAKGTWNFQSEYAWPLFGESFRQELSEWKPGLLLRASKDVGRTASVDGRPKASDLKKPANSSYQSSEVENG